MFSIGLRTVVLVVLGLLTVGSILRTVTTNTTAYLVVAHACGILNGIGGVMAMAAPPVVAASWFKESERIFATSISQVSSSAKKNSHQA